LWGDFLKRFHPSIARKRIVEEKVVLFALSTVIGDLVLITDSNETNSKFG
jgi:hypothetical protein